MFGSCSGLPGPPLQFRLLTGDRAQLRNLLAGGVQPLRAVLRALALQQIAGMIQLTTQAIRTIGFRFSGQSIFIDSKRQFVFATIADFVAQVGCRCLIKMAQPRSTPLRSL